MQILEQKVMPIIAIKINCLKVIQIRKIQFVLKA